MGKLKPWYHVVTPREDLRQNRPLDASEFAVHLDQIRAGAKSLHEDYRKPERFFARTYLTGSLLDLCSQVVRRLSGEMVETSAVFNMSTQFGGGKTHALAALFHLARGGPQATDWKGVDLILNRAQVSGVPAASTAVIVGTEADILKGRGGNGEPVRRTLWGEIAWQLGGAQRYALVKEHDERGIVPGGDVLSEMLPDGPVLILMDELLSFISRGRGSKGQIKDDRLDLWTRDEFANQLFNFLHTLTEHIRGRKNAVLCVSIPASELEMTKDDQRDFESLKKVLDRASKAIMMSEKEELAEIIRRRLFDWEGLSAEANKTISTYADWVNENSTALAGFEDRRAADKFRATYPFHPSLISVFERKWQSLPRFQRTRGVLRLLALWVSHNYQEQHRLAAGEPLISLGSAPLSYPTFRAALFEQLGNERLEIPVTTDIAGKPDSHAVRLDAESDDAARKTQLHQQVATVVFFESNGGQSQSRAEAQLAEIKAGAGAPEGTLGDNLSSIETALEELTDRCFYLSTERNRYRFSVKPNLNQVFVTKRQGITDVNISDHVKGRIMALFEARPKDRDFDRKIFPGKSAEIPNAPQLTLVVLGPDNVRGESATTALMESLLREYGSSGRTFKSALIFCPPDPLSAARDAAKNYLAWQDLDGDADTKKNLEDAEKAHLKRNLDRAAKDVDEALFRAYHWLYLLGKDNQLKEVDLGSITSSQAERLAELMLQRLVDKDEVVDAIAPERLVQNWPHMTEWSTEAVRDAFYSSPKLPRPRQTVVIKRMIARGVQQGLVGYVRKDGAGSLQLERFKTDMHESDVEFADDVFLVREKDVVIIREPPRLTRLVLRPDRVTLHPGELERFVVSGEDQRGQAMAVPGVTFSTSGGTSEVDGEAVSYIAGTEPGNYEVGAHQGEQSARAEIEIRKKAIIKDEPQEQWLRWRGVVPSQKWMQFYQKVISRFATTPGLKIEVSFEVKLDGEAGRAKAEEARQALTDLGLPANIEIVKGR